MFVLQASERPGGVYSAVMHSDGSGGDLLSLQGGGSKHPATEATIQQGKHFIEMDGKEVFRFATRVMAQATREALDSAGMNLEEIDWIIPHQANIRIMEASARKLKLPLDRLISTVERHGNTSAASIPLALDESVRSGRIKRGDTLLLEGVGGGFTWGGVLLRY